MVYLKIELAGTCWFHKCKSREQNITGIFVSVFVSLFDPAFFTGEDVRQIAGFGYDHIRFPVDEEQIWAERAGQIKFVDLWKQPSDELKYYPTDIKYKEIIRLYR